MQPDLSMKFFFKPVAYLVFLLMVSGCNPAVNDNSQTMLLQTADLSLTVSPGLIPVETPLRLTLASSEDIQAVIAEVSGVSMYMGRIPLHWRKLDATSGSRWQTEFLLGACTDPQMRWQLQLTLTFADGRVQLLQHEFRSSW